MTEDQLYLQFCDASDLMLLLANEHLPSPVNWEQGQIYQWWSYPQAVVFEWCDARLASLPCERSRRAALDLYIAARLVLLAKHTSVNEAMLWKLQQTVIEDHGYA